MCVPKQKVVERFHRNRSKAAKEDVAERVFLVAERRVEVTYHPEDHRLISSKRSFVMPRLYMKEKEEDIVAGSGFQVGARLQRDLGFGLT